MLSDFVDPDSASDTLNGLLGEIELAQHSVKFFGKSVLQPRLIGWQSALPYCYSGFALAPRPWTPGSKTILDRVNQYLAQAAPEAPPFNHVLFNFYRHGEDSMGMHADDESELGPDPFVASLSLGGERRFIVAQKKKFRRVSPERLEFQLTSGSLLLMKAPMQKYYLHGLPKTAKPVQPRLNLTFRHILSGS
jgi:alkylated DNA repair dioxygenase AlkB